MNRLGVIILLIGLGLLVVSLFADAVGIGDNPGFGLLQIAGTAAGVLFTALGLIYAFRRKEPQD
jgi:hypothetical protein